MPGFECFYLDAESLAGAIAGSLTARNIRTRWIEIHGTGVKKFQALNAQADGGTRPSILGSLGGRQ